MTFKKGLSYLLVDLIFHGSMGDILTFGFTPGI